MWCRRPKTAGCSRLTSQFASISQNEPDVWDVPAVGGVHRSANGVAARLRDVTLDQRTGVQGEDHGSRSRSASTVRMPRARRSPSGAPGRVGYEAEAPPFRRRSAGVGDRHWVGAGRNHVGQWSTSDGDPNQLATSYGSQRLGQRPLEFSNTDLRMWPTIADEVTCPAVTAVPRDVANLAPQSIRVTGGGGPARRRDRRWKEPPPGLHGHRRRAGPWWKIRLPARPRPGWCARPAGGGRSPKGR